MTEEENQPPVPQRRTRARTSTRGKAPEAKSVQPTASEETVEEPEVQPSPLSATGSGLEAPPFVAEEPTSVAVEPASVAEEATSEAEEATSIAEEPTTPPAEAAAAEESIPDSAATHPAAEAGETAPEPPRRLGVFRSARAVPPAEPAQPVMAAPSAPTEPEIPAPTEPAAPSQSEPAVAEAQPPSSEADDEVTVERVGRRRTRGRRRGRPEAEVSVDAEPANVTTGGIADAAPPEPEAELKDEAVQESSMPISAILDDATPVSAADEAPGVEPQVSEGEAAESADQDAAAEPSAPTRGRRRTAAAAFPVEINVNVPRGMSKRVDAKLIQRAVQGALQRDGWERAATLEVHIVTDQEMREVNATRRGIDEVTDVLSFPLMEVQPGGQAHDFFVLPPETPEHLGEVVISYERVESQADEGGHSREREWAFLTVHAVLHILGYDHDTDEKRRLMRRKEEEVLGELGLRRNGGAAPVAPAAR
jgi:probable rRNA maturation factor